MSGRHLGAAIALAALSGWSPETIGKRSRAGGNHKSRKAAAKAKAKQRAQKQARKRQRRPS